MPGTVAEGAPTVSTSFANNFWGKEDAGVHPLLERMHNAKVTSDELKGFYSTRAAIEDEYARKMTALCRKPLGSAESGTLRASLDVLRGEVDSMGKAHQGIAHQMKSELEEPLAAFAGGMKERRKIVQTGIEKLFKTKQQQTQAVNKSRDRYEQDCLKIKGYLAQGHMVMGQEERKNKAKMEKTQIQLASTSNEYEAAVKILEETTNRWNREWKAACDKFQDLEEERLDFMKSSLWTFANVASTVCVSDDASCEKIRLTLEGCEVEKDISSFIRDCGTGQEIPEPPKYINFCRGDLNDNGSVVSEDEGYTIAQFQRTINPAFRSSSPQPSMLESHHDPQSELAMRMGHLATNTPPSRETTLTPQTNSQQQPAPPMLDYRPQPQTRAPYQIKADDVVTVPHNEYPAEGMTMFCRTDKAQSERSSAASPVRPSSRDSQSEYSNPTSFSSMEPTSSQHSPTKQMIPIESPLKQVQKKRSGFFSNSPFRRKSKHEREAPNVTTPTARNTYGAASKDQTTSRQNNRDGYSGSPEPVDPRANFQLNVGPNVFDVAHPDSNRGSSSPRKMASPSKELVDPIAAALEELKGVNKQSSVRMSADRYAGVSTPAPPSASGVSSTDPATAHRPTPPPSYASDQKVRRLDAPQPAFTSSAMRQATQKYVGQNQDMYGTGSRPGTRSGNNNNSDMPRATSPRPMRSTSPRPDYNRSVSPNPYNSGGGRPRQTPNTSPTKSTYKHNSPNDVGRSPPGAGQQRYGRQESSRASSGQGMAMQIAEPPHGSNPGPRNGGRPQSYYGVGPPQQQHQRGQDPQGANGRARSRSMANGKQYSQDGRPIVQYARALYMYRAAIPEELSFAKGDVLAVTRLQDDGWWEAEVTGKRGKPGLVPSNYLQPC